MLLYIHVPFCRSKCRYCAFHSMALGKNVRAQDSPAVKNYVDTLLLELAVAGEQYAGVGITSVFFGGGTPSLLPPGIVQVVIDRIGRYFTLAPTAEITLEANPESLRSAEQVRALLRAGVNRLSIGLQSLSDPMLRLLGRSHRLRDSMYAVQEARNAGMPNISVDLMWGLPGQSVRQWLNTVREVTRMKPDHISAYGLTLEEGTPMEKEYSEGRIKLPPERDQSVMFMEGAAILEEQGYLHYEISNFARMGYQCRHNLGYWEGEDYLGLGPSATSTVSGRRWSNPADQEAWAAYVQARCPHDHDEILTPQIRVLELIMLRLRTSRGLRLKAYRELTGRNFLKDHERLIRALHENGLIRIRDGYLRLTRSGMLVSNSILTNLFAQTEALLLPRPQGKKQPEQPHAAGTPRDPALDELHAAMEAAMTDGRDTPAATPPPPQPLAAPTPDEAAAEDIWANLGYTQAGGR